MRGLLCGNAKSGADGLKAWAVWRVFQMDRKNRADDGDLSAGLTRN